MRNTVLTVLGAAVLAASTTPMAAAAEHHHARWLDRATVDQRYRHANNEVFRPVQPNWYSDDAPNWYSDYTNGHAISAPAGR